MYGFRRSSTVTSDRRFDHKYFNPNFQRDQPDLLINLNPRKPPKFKIADLKTETLIINDDDDDLYLLNNENNCNAKNTLNSSFSPSKYCKLENELFNFD